MANKSLFRSSRGPAVPRADAWNSEGAASYAFEAEHALAQYAATGCLNSTFYATGEAQLEDLLRLAGEVEPDFLARTAIYCREHGHMKDAPAVLMAVLANRDGALMEWIFERVIDNARMLRTFVQVLRSGVTGRKSLGSRPKRCVRRWLANRTSNQLVRGAVGNDPSLADIVRMVHPAPADDERRALYAWLIDKPHDKAALPALVREFEAWKRSLRAGHDVGEAPNVPFQMLAGLPLGRPAWTAIARNARWQMTRMNLNTFIRRGVFSDDELGRAMVRRVAERLRDKEAIRKARVFPYQLLAAYVNASTSLPREIRDALHDAMEIATRNVPKIKGRVFICPDVSGSMTWTSVTGSRRGATSKVRCVDVAALFTAALLRKNPDAEVLPFEHEVVPVHLEPRNTVLTNARDLAKVGGGGTALSAPLDIIARRAKRGHRIDAVIFVSDNESWFDARRWGSGIHGTKTLRLWNKIQRNNPDAKLVCIDLQPNGTTQAPDRPDVMNVGGFSDAVFERVAEFLDGKMTPDHWVGVIRKVELGTAPRC